MVHEVNLLALNNVKNLNEMNVFIFELSHANINLYYLYLFRMVAHYMAFMRCIFHYVFVHSFIVSIAIFNWLYERKWSANRYMFWFKAVTPKKYEIFYGLTHNVNLWKLCTIKFIALTTESCECGVTQEEEKEEKRYIPLDNHLSCCNALYLYFYSIAITIQGNMQIGWYVR